MKRLQRTAILVVIGLAASFWTGCVNWMMATRE